MSKYGPLWLQVSYVKYENGTYGYRIHYLHRTESVKEGKGYRTKSAAYSAGYRAIHRVRHPYSTESGAPL